MAMKPLDSQLRLLGADDEDDDSTILAGLLNHAPPPPMPAYAEAIPQRRAKRQAGAMPTEAPKVKPKKRTQSPWTAKGILVAVLVFGLAQVIIGLTRAWLPVAWPSHTLAVCWAIAIAWVHRRRVMIARDGSTLAKYTPQWGVNFAYSLRKAPRSLQFIIGAVAFLLVIISAGMILAGGYMSIQGVRIVLSMVGLVTLEGLMTWPPLMWWIFPAILTLIQVLTRPLREVKGLWWASVVLDASTNAAFFAYGMLAIIGSGAAMVQLALLAAHVGLIWAIVAEQLGLTAALVLRTMYEELN